MMVLSIFVNTSTCLVKLFLLLSRRPELVVPAVLVSVTANAVVIVKVVNANVVPSPLMTRSLLALSETLLLVSTVRVVKVVPLVLGVASVVAVIVVIAHHSVVTVLAEKVEDPSVTVLAVTVLAESVVASVEIVQVVIANSEETVLAASVVAVIVVAVRATGGREAKVEAEVAVDLVSAVKEVVSAVVAVSAVKEVVLAIVVKEVLPVKEVVSAVDRATKALV